MKKDQPLWLVVIQNTKTKKNTYFNQWGDNPDEVLKKISDGFFDQKLLSMTISKDSKISDLERNKEIAFPIKSIKILVIKKCKDFEEFKMLRDKIRKDE